MDQTNPFPPSDREYLDPADLRIAADAFEAALAALGPVDDPQAVRHSLARYIIERIFDGQRDSDRLRDGGLAHLRLGAAGPGS
jgi:hypothetical protein